MKHDLKPRQKHHGKHFLLSAFCLLLSACGGSDFADLDQKIAEIKARPKGNIDPLPPVKTVAPFSFELDGSRDPFKPLEKEAAPDADEEPDNGIKPDPNRIKEDLESSALDTLKMVGTLKEGSELWGLVQSKTTGTVYRVKAGNYMGLNDGKIIEISNDEIKLMEIVPDKSSDKEKKRWSEQKASLQLVTPTK